MAARRQSGSWGGRRVQEARVWVADHTTWPAKCARCGTKLDRDGQWVVGHIKDRVTHPHLTWVPSNWQVECRPCSDAGGQPAVIAKAKADALRDAAQPALLDFPRPAPGSQSPPLPLSLPSQPSQPDPEPFEISPDLAWNPCYLSQFDWLRDLASNVPENAAPPLAMSPVPEDAVGSYGVMAVAWIETELKVTLRWWQKLSIIRQLEHRANGSLCFRVKIESAPRRAGKSLSMRGNALWRQRHGAELFGEVQTIMHTGKDMAICREIQRGAWSWSEAHGWGVIRANGKEAIETPSGDRWMVRAQDAVYGYDVTLGIVDEAWDVEPRTINEGLRPAMMERLEPQMIITSTSNSRATSLMRSMIAGGLAGTSPRTLLLLWGARPGDDMGDPAVWRAANPHWSQDRQEEIADAYQRALDGISDPEFDDPDPMRAFESNYLNVWRITAKVLLGEPITTDLAWAELTRPTPPRTPDAVAVEQWYDGGVTVACAWKAGDTTTVATSDWPTLDDAAFAVSLLGFRKTVTVGESLALNPAWTTHRIRVAKKSTSARACVADLMKALANGTWTHDGSGPITDQVLGLRISKGTDGPRIRTTSRLDAIKAATWAAQTAATTRPPAALPSRYTVKR